MVLHFSLLLLLFTGAAVANDVVCKARHPIILIHGATGSILDMSGNIPDSYQLPRHCKHVFPQRRAWVSLTEFIPGRSCFEAYLMQHWSKETKSWYDTPGVEVRVAGKGNGDTFPVDRLETSGLTGDLTNYYHDVIVGLKNASYVAGKDLVAAPYDWRRRPYDKWFEETRELIESVTAGNDGRRAVIVAHSMGAMWAYLLLMRQSAEWKNKYVEHFVPVSPAWMGSMISVKYLFEGAGRFMPLTGKFARSTPALWAMFPRAFAWPKDTIAVSTPSRNYTYSQIDQILSAFGVDDIDDKIRYANEPFAKWFEYNVFPGMPTTCLIAPGSKTMQTMVFDVDFNPSFGDKWPHRKSTIMSDGDDAVPTESLRYACDKWHDAGHPVAVEKIADADHSGILKKAATLDKIMKIACAN